MEPHLSVEQARFRKDISTTHQVPILRLIAEKLNIVDIRRAFDSIKHDVTWPTVRSYGMELERLIKIQHSSREISQSAWCELAENCVTGSNDCRNQTGGFDVTNYFHLVPRESKNNNNVYSQKQTIDKTVHLRAVTIQCALVNRYYFNS